MKVRIVVKRLSNSKGLPLPSYESLGAAGADLRAALDQPLQLEPGHRALIPTGFALALPTGYEAQVRPRSGLSVKLGLTVLNAPGTVDSDYRGEIMIPLINLGQDTISLEHGMRVAQMIIAPVVQGNFEEVLALEDTARGEDGFGSTGV